MIHLSRDARIDMLSTRRQSQVCEDSASSVARRQQRPSTVASAGQAELERVDSTSTAKLQERLAKASRRRGGAQGERCDGSSSGEEKSASRTPCRRARAAVENRRRGAGGGVALVNSVWCQGDLADGQEGRRCVSP